MKVKLAVLLISLLLAIPTTGIATIVQIPPSQDTYTIWNAPDLSTHARAYMIVKEITIGPYDEAWAYIQFDLESIPPDAVIDAAYLYLNQSDVDCGGTKLTLHKVTSAWVDETTTWNNSPTFDSSIHRSIEGPAPCGWFITPLTSLVSAWHQGTFSNNGIMIRQTEILSMEDPDPRTFSSSEAATFQPKLVVVYNSTSTAVEPGMDAYVSKADPATNFGTDVDLLLSGSISESLRSYLRFDLSGIPTGSTIEFARLRLYHYYDPPFGSNGSRAGVFGVTQPWDEWTITWDDQPMHGVPPESYQGAYGDPDFTGRMDWIVTDLAAGWFNNPSTNNGVVVKHHIEDLSSDVTGTFRSSDVGDDSFWPYLEVFYSEPPPNSFVDWQHLPGVFFSDAQWGDLDGDEDKDLVLCGQAATDTVTVTYENQSGTLVVLPNSLPGVMGDGSGPLALGDYDNDGDLDLAMAGLGKTTIGPIARIYTNDGNGGFTWDTAQVLTGVRRASLAWGDVDNDGDLDLVVQGLDESSSSIATLYLNHPTGTLTADGTTTLTGLRNGSVDWADFDNDGDMDLLRTGHDTAGVTRTIYSMNYPVGTLIEDGAHGLPDVGMSDAACGDFDRDGWMDVAISGQSNGTPSQLAMVYRNTGAGQFAPHTANLLSIYRSSCAWGDFDNDGRLDVAFCGWTGSSQITNVYRCNTDYGFGFFQTVGSTREGSLTWVDVDDDADLDLFVTGSFSTTKLARVYENIDAIPNTPPTPPTAIAACQNYLIPPANGDLYITWSGATDMETSLPGLYYCVRVGTGYDLGIPTDDVFSGTYGTPLMGNVGEANTWKISVPYGVRPYWVQIKTIDSGLMASEWSDVFCTYHDGEMSETTIYSVDDTYVNNQYPNQNYSVADQDRLILGDITASGDYCARSYIQFYIGGDIPLGTEVMKAELHLYCFDNPSGAPYWVTACEEFLDLWSEETITWNNAPTTFRSSRLPVTRIMNAGWYVWDVTNEVKSCCDGGVSFVMRSNDPSEAATTSWLEFYSDNHGSPYRPYLKVWAGTLTGVEDDTPEANRFALSQNVPNPFNPETRVTFTIPSGTATGPVSLKIYDVVGRLVQTLVDEPREAGLHTVEWNGKDRNGSPVASGVYFYRLKWNEIVESKKMVLLR